MIVSPLDYRYGRDNVKNIFSEETRLNIMLNVEAAIAQAESYYGIIPEEAYADIRKVVDNNEVKIGRVKEIEAIINHDVMSIVEGLTEKCTTGKNYVHFGVTSNDINDSASAVQMKRAISIIISDLEDLGKALVSRIKENEETIMVGRTHGQHASPITLGLKFAVYLSEIGRHLERIQEARKRIIAGKILGPVGTGAALGKNALKIQEKTCEILGITHETGSTQIVGRDRYIEYLSIINNISVSMEKFATEIRNLQRPEIYELSEYFDSDKQVGSSSMPSKRNPIVSENIVSLARLTRSFIIPEYEAGVQWHERDLTNSALERFTIPYVSILADDIITKMTGVFSHLFINREEMKKRAYGDEFIMSESVTTTLTENGMPRQDAHEFVREASMHAYKQKKTLKETLVDMGILNHISEKILDRAMEPENFLGVSKEICEDAIKNFDNLQKYLAGEIYD
ncbi:adenylosuccinate lyase [Ferroplasma acidiphilum]|uniref:Adenylosuccinate lyase n=1 Tax=Ferroplasma acidiphilum TaxID=74969 RepID=A0A1V0N5C5_9ARCH|nr:adenylosuccinate lyase [Ferroplasma acidiphilum]ARD85296.1 adenylosuccinate lyase [Ferroplasma acidiphilum]